MRVALLVLAFAFAVPASACAQEAVVGEPQVITDPGTETEPAGDDLDQEDVDVYGEEDGPAADDGTPPAEPPPPDESGRRGELHILGASATSASEPVTRRDTLPFTGPNPAPLAGAGLILLAAGLALRRHVPRTRPCPR